MQDFMFVHPDDILVKNDRQRQTFDADALKRLATSIREHGLIQPPVVEELPEGNFQLIAGERRIRAMREILEGTPDFSFSPNQMAAGLIPVMLRTKLDDVMRFALELEENIQREDLPFLEKAVAIAKLHELRNISLPGGQTIAETATEIKAAKSTVSDALLIAKHANVPEVREAKTAKEAVKVIEKKAAEVHRAELAKKFDLTKTPHTLIRGDSKEELSKLPEGSIDHIWCDPPYGIGADSFGDQASTGHAYEDSLKAFHEMLNWLPEQLFRIAKKDAFAYICCAFERFDELSLAFGLAGWRVWARPIIWNKMKSGMLPVPDKGPRYTYECILYAWKGDRKVVKQGMPDVLDYPVVKRLEHGAEKPAALVADLLGRVALPGDKVLDAFLGSAPSVLACNTLRLTLTGIELSEASYNLAISRLSQAVKDEPIDRAPDIQL